MTRSAPPAHRSLLTAVVLVACAAGALRPTAGRARADEPAPAPVPTGGLARIASHDLHVRFEPATHRVVARDVIAFDTSAGRRVALSLPSGTVTSSQELSIDGTVGRTDLPIGVDRLELSYATTVFDAVEKTDDLTWVVGDATTGLVSEKGIYLTGASGWIAADAEGPARPARFDVTTYVPEPFLVVTQGSVPARSRVLAPKGWSSDAIVAPPAAADGAASTAYAVSTARATLPTDDLSVCAGPYRVATRTIRGLPVSTYLYASEADAAPLWLDAMDEVVARYERRLGPYPHPKFDIVENFFQTGYGMPSFTLLGDEVIRYVTAGARTSGGRIPPGYLDHEYVHGWFGNGLLVDPTDGNWCEALTTYLSNYLAKELESAEAGREARRGTLERYAIRVTPETDYAVRAFRTKSEDKDNDVGYGKGSLVFHALRARLGDDAFFARLRDVIATRAGTFVSWDDWVAALDGAWALPYLERTGLPAVRLASATAWPRTGADAGVTLRAEIVVDAPRGEAPWPDVDVAIAADGKVVGSARLSGSSVVWTTTLAAAPSSVEIDPDVALLRRIAPGDLPACLRRTTAAKGGAIRRRGAESVFGPLAARLAKETGFAVEPPTPVGGAGTGAAPGSDGRPVVDLRVLAPGERFTFLGGPTSPRVVVEEGAVTVDGTRHEGADLSVLVSENDPTAPRTVFVATSDAAAARAAYLPYYGWDAFVVFEAGRRTPLARGRLDAGATQTRRAVTVGGASTLAVLDTLTTLTAPELEGRRPGSAGHERAAVELTRRLDALFADVQPAATTRRVEFPLGVAELTSSRDLTITTATGTVVLKDAFRPLCASPARAKGVPLELGEGENPIPLPGRIPDTSATGLARIWKQIDVGIAPALFLLPSKEGRAALAPFLDTPESLTAESEAELAAPGRDGRPRPRPVLAPWIAARRARGFPGLRPLRIPVLIVTEEAYEAIFAMKDILTADFEVSFGPERATTDAGKGGESLVLAYLPPGSPEERPPVVVVSAHYDSFGRDGARFLAGADDNASGVACVLEALAGAKETLAGAKRGLVVCLFDGEEWGLLGSRALAPALAARYDVKAVVNVDAVGRVKADQVHVVGLSTHPDLGRAASDALKGAGLLVGPDIDRHAYAEGSDHWPFHEAGIPAITLWASDYATMNTERDDLASVDPVGVARLAVAVRALLRGLLTAP